MASTEDSAADGAVSESHVPVVHIFDHRGSSGKDIKLPRLELNTFDAFCKRVRQEFDIKEDEEHVFTNTAREEICDDAKWGLVEGGESIYVLQEATQTLATQTLEKVSYLPHYDTIVKGGMYEYYASEGQNPLPYAFAELIDNSLAATAANFGPRKIEIRLHLDEERPNKNSVFVIDNGKGMTSRQLNNWAIYRLSKFIRKDPGDDSESGESQPAVPTFLQDAPRSLNSDISYFGVGGKQAIFFIGTSTRMISKPKESQDVHELTISKEAFEEKEKNNEDIYSGIIRNRQRGDSSHLTAEDETLKNLISEEKEKENFTVVCINGLSSAHIPYLKSNVEEWTTQLAHIYHYYVHGPNGNSGTDDASSNFFQNIDILVKLYLKGKPPIVLNLKDIDDDMQTRYLRTAASTFEFKATVEGTGIVEGVMRYHPFLYNKETFPPDNNPNNAKDPELEDEEDVISDFRPARGKRPIFECYWNGRLIPYTAIDDFPWCAMPKKSKTTPIECFNRVSGVLWTNDKFQVSTNKLTFIDLEMRLRDKNTAYCRVIGKNEKRTDIGREFTSWLNDCYEQFDKQVKFSQFQNSLMRKELPKNRQGPWGIFHQIEWDGKVYKIGDVVRIARTNPQLYGSISKFYLFGEYAGDVFATGGEIQVVQEPKSLYDDTRVVSLNKLDRTASETHIQKYISDEESKLPEKLVVTWPEGEPVKNGEKRQAGKPINDIKVEIANKKGEMISKLPGSAQRKLLVELKITWHSQSGDEVIVHHISQHGKTWPYWFRKMENIRKLGSHTILLQAVVTESSSRSFAGRELPTHTIKFTVTEGAPARFSVGMLEGPFRIGIPFQIPLEFQDEFGNPTKPSGNIKPELEASGVELNYESVAFKQNALLVKNVVAVGSIPTSIGKSFNMVVKLNGLAESTQSMKIRLLPGPPHALRVLPEELQEIENGGHVTYNVEIVDKAGNPTAQHKLGVLCKFITGKDLPVATIDLSRSGQGTIKVENVLIKRIKGVQLISAKLDVTGVKNIASLEREVRVKPSTRASTMTMSYEEDGEQIPVKGGMELQYKAGGSLRGLTFTVFDEAGQVKEIDDQLAAKMKANWVPKLARDTAKKGMLPDIKVPTSTIDNKYCSVNLQDGSGLEFSFTIVPVPGDPAQLVCNCLGSSKVQLGQTLEDDIEVNVYDKHGNEITKFEKGVLEDLTLSCEDLILNETVRMLGSKSGFNISGIKFGGNALGPRQLVVNWRSLTDSVHLEIVPGQPAKLALVGWDLSQPFVISNGAKLPKNMRLQLCDDLGNPTPEANVRLQLAKEFGSTVVTSNPHPGKTDAKGHYDFGHLTVSGKKGIYEIQPKAFWGRVIISGPKFKVHIQPDANKPVRLDVTYPTIEDYIAGETLPDIQVKVYAEDDSIMGSSKVSCLKMKVWKPEKGSKKEPPQKCQSYGPSSEKGKPGHFTFSKRPIPQETGSYMLGIYYRHDESTEIAYGPIKLTVVSGAPESLEAIQDPGTPTVSNTPNAQSRCLVRSLFLQLRDKYNNPAGSDVSGKLKVEIIKESGTGEVPCMVGNTRTSFVKLHKGQAQLQNLTIQENTPGKDGQEYVLRCTISESSVAEYQTIPAYDIPFLFYNDVKKQSQMAALSRERDSLRNCINTYRSLFETTQQLIGELRTSVSEYQSDEKKQREALRRMGLSLVQLQSLKSVDHAIVVKEGEKETVGKQTRRLCGLQEVAKDPDVLGKIAHLALVEENDIARVLSWHMSADMDCVVTVNTKKAKQIYKETNGKQQVLPLDSIYRRNLPDWNKPLPHTKINRGWKPAGNPVYARNLLIFPNEATNCQIVFGMLLGDTIILDNLDSANAYRTEIVKHNHCPTILTREGDRIRSNGKFGGLMNKALPLERLRGAVFGAPLPRKFDELGDQIESLHSLKAAIHRRQEAELELNDQLSSQNTPEMKSKVRECQEAEEQLAVIEEKLGMTSTRATPATKKEKGRSGKGAEEPPIAQPQFNDGPAPKRARTSAAGVNGSPSASPARQSLRRAAIASPPYAEMAGKAKRSRRN